MSYRTPKRGGCRGKKCKFIGGWIPLEIVELLDRSVERNHSDRSKLLRIALEEKLARVGS